MTREVEAFLFDFDGLLVDTESAALQSWQEVFKRHNRSLTLKEWEQAFRGSGVEFDPLHYLEGTLGVSLDGSRKKVSAARLARKYELSMQLPAEPGVQQGA